MLRNSLYRGEVIWNRREFRMYTDPDTGRTTRRAYRLPPEQWLRRTDESLRIVSAELWRRCERRMKATAERNARQKYRGGRRDAQYKRLFDLVCDECGGRYVMVSGRELGCSTHRSGGRSACSNDRRIKLAVANRVLLAMLCDPKDGLLSDEVIREVRRHAARYVRQAKRSAAARAGAASQLRKQIADLDTRSPALWTR